MLPTIEEIKNYLRIDGTEDDLFLGSLITVAQEDLKASGVKTSTSERYRLAIMLLVANHYEERRPQVIGTITSNVQYSLERLILQLRAEDLPGDE